MNTTVQEIYQNNLRRQYTDADAKQFDEAEKQLAANRLDVRGPGATRNIDLIDDFFQKNRGIPVTLQTIYKAVEQRKNEFVWHSSAAEAEWYQTAQQNPDLANQLAAHLATHGQVGRLVNDGDQLFENLTLLFREIHSRRESASPYTIAGAEDRIAHRPGRQLHRVPKPRRTEPVSRAAKADDGSPFLGELVRLADGTFRSKTPAEQRRDQEAAERAKSQTQTTTLDASEATWKSMADGLLHDGTHSQQARVKAVYDQELFQGSSWRKIFEACKREVNLSKSRSFVR
jgi:hypothetical protein